MTSTTIVKYNHSIWDKNQVDLPYVEWGRESTSVSALLQLGDQTSEHVAAQTVVVLIVFHVLQTNKNAQDNTFNLSFFFMKHWSKYMTVFRKKVYVIYCNANSFNFSDLYTSIFS